MPKRTDKLLADIVLACEAVLLFVHGRQYDDFVADLMLRSAVERQLMIVGEAIRQLRDVDACTVVHITDYKRIIDFRNILAHGYDAISNDIVWQVVSEKIPALLIETRMLQDRAAGPK
jgi:uncharacterized protein with HEPN domain